MDGADTLEAADMLGVVLGSATAATEIRFELGPIRLDGGRSADLFRFRLSSGPTDLTGRDLVLRLLPPQATARDECVIQREVARLGYPAPQVVRSGLVDGTRIYMIMTYVEGVSLFEAQHPLRTFRRVPPRLAELMLSLHRIDPTPVRLSLEDLGGSAALNARARALADVDSCFSAIEHPARRELRRWFEQAPSAAGRQVVCHGDLHALNVLVNGDTAVIDWELAAIGDPGFDVARTKLLLHAVPMALPSATRPLIQHMGQRAASRFEGAYTATSPIASDVICWYEALHAARMAGLILASGVRSGVADAVIATWKPTLPLLIRLLERLTGVAVAV